MNDLAVAETFNPGAMMLNTDAMGNLMRFAEQMSASKITVPAHLRGSPADCLAICFQAAQWGMNPFAVAQKTHLVNGTLGYEAQLVNAVVQSSGAIDPEGFSYEYRGAGVALECRVGAKKRGQENITWNEFLCVSEVTTKNSPLWKTNPKQQLGYLQVKNWARLFTPGAILGVYTADELEKVERVPDDGADAPAVSTQSLTPQRKAPPPADIVDVEVRPPAPAPTAPVASPPPPAAAPAQADPISGTVASTAHETGTTSSGDDTGELASMGHKRRLETLAQANDKNLTLIYAQNNIDPSRLTVAQFNVVLKAIKA